jgi:hypothetical protein
MNIIQRYELHPFCVAFRRANAREKAEIIDKMKAYGYDVAQPITLYEGMVLDGGTRQDAAVEAGVEPTFTTFVGDDDEARAFVIRRNKACKQLTKGELDLALARLIMVKRGAPKGNRNGSDSNGSAPSQLKSGSEKTIAMVAKEAGRGVGTIWKARELVCNAALNVLAMVEAGEIGTSNGADGIRSKTKDEQAQMTAADLHEAIRHARGINNKKKLKEPKPKRRAFEPYRPQNLSKIPGINPSSSPSQRVHLHPPHEAGLLKDDLFLIDATAKIVAAAEIDPKAIDAAIGRLRAYEGKYQKVDFAASAEIRLEKLAGSLDAIERLAALLREIVARRVKEPVS